MKGLSVLFAAQLIMTLVGLTRVIRAADADVGRVHDKLRYLVLLKTTIFGSLALSLALASVGLILFTLVPNTSSLTRTQQWLSRALCCALPSKRSVSPPCRIGQ
jgi:hypothetical protein